MTVLFHMLMDTSVNISKGTMVFMQLTLSPFTITPDDLACALSPRLLDAVLIVLRFCSFRACSRQT